MTSTAFLLLLASVFATILSTEVPDCSGGACPVNYDTIADPKDFDSGSSGTEKCTMWLGPSPIKNVESHGFGLGMFTGRNIAKGTSVESLYGGAEVMLPLYGSETIYEIHPPLREYVWDEDNMPEVSVEYPIGLTALFIPGLAAIAPCTSQNYNLELVGVGKAGDSRDSVVSDSSGVHRSRHATAGSFAYRHNVSYRAIRDITAGEELTVECSDDDYDGGAYYLSHYDQKDDAVVCLDQNLQVKRSRISGAGQGLFAKRDMMKSEIIISTPLIPIHRMEMDIDDDEVNTKQLMLNYCYGHPGSDLLFLPYGPLISYVNHSPQPNAQIRWHTPVMNQTLLDRRQQHHHVELFEQSAKVVSKTHGKALMMDLVALRKIRSGEEITIDYGEEWSEAWKKHSAQWTEKGQDYQSAEEFNKANTESFIRTFEEQKINPYPENLEVFCFYHLHDDGDDERDDDAYDAKFHWYNDERHPCFRPCHIAERFEDGNTHLYTVKLLKKHDIRVIDHCVIEETYVVSDVPQWAIRIMDKPYTTDVLLSEAFRHEIGVPEGLYPSTWMKTKLRKRKGVQEQSVGDEFKRKKSVKTVEINPQ